MKNTILILFCVLGLSFAAYRFYDNHETLVAAELETATQTAIPIPAASKKPPVRSLDIDAMAARMRNYQEVYQKLRDETLAVYNKRNPVKGSHYQAAETAIKLAAYLFVWGDYYQEGLWQAYAASADEACHDTDPNDPLLQKLYTIYDYGTDFGTHDESNLLLMKECEAFVATEYPAAFKFMVYEFMMRNFSHGKMSKKYGPALPQSAALLPGITAQMGEFFKTLAIEKIPDPILFRHASNALNGGQDDADTLIALAGAFDKALEAADPDGALRPAIQGDFQTSYAWNARGGGWADSVTEEGWRLMKERLAKANDILEFAYLKHSDTTYIPDLMIGVELGQSQGRGRMELWFQRALAVDPNDVRPYESKMYYLTPRWHGSIDDMVAFGNECIATGNWESRIPMEALKTLDDIEENKPDIYANPAVWQMVEALYGTYLEKYPESTIRRGDYMKAAVAAGKWEIAQKQLSLLGTNWNRSSFKKDQFQQLKAQIEKQTATQPDTKPKTP